MKRYWGGQSTPIFLIKIKVDAMKHQPLFTLKDIFLFNALRRINICYM